MASSTYVGIVSITSTVGIVGIVPLRAAGGHHHHRSSMAAVAVRGQQQCRRASVCSR